MTRAAFILGGLAVALTGPAAAATAGHAVASAQATIVAPAAVRMGWPMAMPSVQGGPQGATFQGTMPAMGMGMMMPANARLTIRRQDDSGQPVTAPTNFEVVATGERDALIVRTGGTADVRLADNAAIAGGALLGGAATSIDVTRGGLTLVANTPVPSVATLVVLVQYN